MSRNVYAYFQERPGPESLVYVGYLEANADGSETLHLDLLPTRGQKLIIPAARPYVHPVPPPQPAPQPQYAPPQAAPAAPQGFMPSPPQYVPAPAPAPAPAPRPAPHPQAAAPAAPMPAPAPAPVEPEPDPATAHQGFTSSGLLDGMPG